MNLSDISLNFKKVIKYLAIGLVILALLWLLWLLLTFLFGLLIPKKTGPNLAFGKLPPPFTSNYLPNPVPTYILDTPGGSFPETPPLLTVYKVPNVEGKFTSLETAKKIASENGLDATPTKISESEWAFTSKKLAARNLRYNIVTGNFTYTYDWVADPSSLVGIFKTNDIEISEKAKGFLRNFRALRTDLKNGSTRITFWKLAGDTRNQVSSYSDANAILVEIFRDKIKNKYEIVEGNPNKASINVLISPNQRSEKKLLELNYVYWYYDESKPGTYPPKPPSQAYKELTGGKAFVVVGNGEAFEEITIGKVKLAYLNPLTEVHYFQPIYVFEGDGLVKGVRKPFIAYVSAIDHNYQQ